MRNKFLIALLATAQLFALTHEYYPGSVAPPQAWAPLRHADFPKARKLADSLISVLEKSGAAQKNLGANRLEGATQIADSLLDPLSLSRIGEKGLIFLKSKPLGEVALKAFHLGWVDFYGAFIETQYTPLKPFPVDRYYSDALFVLPTSEKSVEPFPLIEESERVPAVKDFLNKLDPPLFEFVDYIDLKLYQYIKKGSWLAMANFSAGADFHPGALLLIREKPGTTAFVIMARYYVGEKAEVVQAVLEEGEVHPVIQAGAFGSGTAFFVLHYDGKTFSEVYKKEKNAFP